MSRILFLARQHYVFSIALAMTAVLLALILAGFSDSWEDARIKAIRASGQPVTLAELDASYAIPSGSSNAADIYLRAFQYPIISPSNAGSALLEGDWPPERGEAFPENKLAEVQAVLDENQEVMRLLHSAAAGMRSRYPIDLTQGFNTLLPHLTKMKRAVTLLCLEAVYHASRGSNAEAIKSVRSATVLSDSVRDEPTLISHLVWIACRTLILSAIERLPQMGQWSDAQLRDLQVLAVSAEHRAGLSHALAAERCFGLAVFTDRQQQAMALGGGANGTGGPSGFAASMMLGALKATGFLRKDRAFYLDAMGHMIDLADKAYPAHFSQVDRSITNMPPSKLYIFSRMLLPALSKTVQRNGDLASRARAIQVSLAIERYRLDTGALPETLDALLPTFLTAIPMDPFTGEPLRYAKRKDGGYTVYGVGSDGNDDGGPSESKKQPVNRDVGLIFVR